MQLGKRDTNYSTNLLLASERDRVQVENRFTFAIVVAPPKTEDWILNSNQSARFLLKHF